MFDTISFEKLLEVTVDDLTKIRDNLGAIYMYEKIPSDAKYVALANAFKTINEWTSYFGRFKEIQDSKLDELKNENVCLVSENNRLNKELNKLTDKYNKQAELVGQLQGRLEMMNEVIKAKNNNANMVQVDIVELIESLERTLNTIETNAKVITQAKKVKLKGELAPAFNNEVRTEDIIKAYQLGETPNQIAQKCGMTQSAIIYRLKQAGVYIGRGKPGRPEKNSM